MAEISLLKENENKACDSCYTSRIGGRTSDDVPLAATLLVHYHENQLARPTAPMSGTQFITPMFQARDVMGPTIDAASKVVMLDATADDIYNKVMDPAHRQDFEKKLLTGINQLLPGKYMGADKVEITSINIPNAFLKDEVLKEAADVELKAATEKLREAKARYDKIMAAEKESKK